MTTAIVAQMSRTQESPAQPVRFPAPPHAAFHEAAVQMERAALAVAKIGHDIRHYDSGGNGLGKVFDQLKPIELAEAMTLARRYVAACQATRIERAKLQGRRIYAEMIDDALEFHRKQNETSSNRVLIGDLLNAIKRELTDMAAVEGLFAGYHAALVLPTVKELRAAVVIEGRTWEIDDTPSGYYWPGELSPLCVCGEWLTEDHEIGSRIRVDTMPGLAPAATCNHCGCQFEIGPAVIVEARR